MPPRNKATRKHRGLSFFPVWRNQIMLWHFCFRFSCEIKLRLKPSSLSGLFYFILFFFFYRVCGHQREKDREKERKLPPKRGWPCCINLLYSPLWFLSIHSHASSVIFKSPSGTQTREFTMCNSVALTSMPLLAPGIFSQMTKLSDLGASLKM